MIIKRMISTFIICLMIVSSIAVSGTTSVGAVNKVSVYVADTVTVSDDTVTSGGLPGDVSEFSYNKKGLLIKNRIRDICTITYGYNKKNLLKKAYVAIDTGEHETYKYKNSGGKRRKHIHISAGGSKTTTDYIYHVQGYLIRAGDKNYRYENGRMVQVMYDYPGAQWSDLIYDDHGNLAGNPLSGVSSDNYYDEYGNLQSKSYYYPASEGIPARNVNYTFTYRKIEVPKKMLSLVKKQQWSLLNDDLDSYFAVAVGWG